MRCRQCGTLHLRPEPKCTICGTRFRHTKARGHRNHRKKMKDKARSLTPEQVKQYIDSGRKQGVPVRTPRGFDNYIPGVSEDDGISIERR